MLTVILREPLAPLVETLLTRFAEGKIDLLEPTLWHYEIVNTLWQKSARFPDTSALMRTITHMKEMGITTRDPEPREVELAFTILFGTQKQTYYDAVYHAMAITQRGTLITGDQRYAKAAAKWGRLLTLDALPSLLHRLR